MQKKTIKGMGYFNILRGVGMLLIIWGHSAAVFYSSGTEGAPLTEGISGVLGGGIMAMFFMISGYHFYRRSPRKCLAIQKKTLLYPYWFTAAAVLASKFLLSVLKKRPLMEHGGEYLLTYLLGLNAEGGGVLWGIPIESVSILWFVLALFGGWMIYNAVLQCKNRKVQWACVCLCMVLAWLAGRISSVWAGCLPQSLAAVFFLAAGAEIRNRQLLERKLPKTVYAAMGVLLLTCVRYGRVDMVNNVWRLGPLDMIGSAVSGFLLLKGYDFFMERLLRERKIACLEFIGFRSMWVLCLHCYEKVVFPWYRLRGLFAGRPFAGTLVCMVLRMLLIFALYRILSQAIAFGKRKLRKKESGIYLED